MMSAITPGKPTASFGSGPLSPHPGPGDDSPRRFTVSTRQKHSERVESRHAEFVKSAENGVIENEKTENYVSFRFTIRHHVSFGSTLFLIGSVRELGSWDVSQAVPLEWTEGDVWKVENVCIKRSSVPQMEYKYIVKTGDVLEWEGGRNHLILAEPTRRMEVEDFWEFPGFTRR